MTFEEWFKQKFGRFPSDSEHDLNLQECFSAGMFSMSHKLTKKFGNNINYETRLNAINTNI